MVKLVEEGLESFTQVSEIHHPALGFQNWPGNVDFDAERMPVDTGTLVTFGNMRQAVCRLDLENPENIHGRIVPPVPCVRND